MFSRQCSAHDRQLLRLLLAARCDELERRLALIEGELFLAAPDHRVQRVGLILTLARSALPEVPGPGARRLARSYQVSLDYR